MPSKNRIKTFKRYKHTKQMQNKEFVKDFADKILAEHTKTSAKQKQDKQKEKSMSHPVINVNYTSTQTRQVNIGLRLELAPRLQQQLDKYPSMHEGVEWMINAGLEDEYKMEEIRDAVSRGAGTRVEVAPDVFLVVPDDDEVNGLCDVEYYENPSEDNGGLWELNDIHEVVL